MSDLEVLFLVLALIYGWECLLWVRRGTVILRTRHGRSWRAVHPGSLLGNQHGGIVFAHPLPPLGTLLAGHQFPLSLSPEGVLVFVSSSVNPGWRPPQSGGFIRFEAVHRVEASGRHVRLNGAPLLKAGSTLFARHVAREVSRLAKLTAPARPRVIAELIQAAFDVEAIRRRWSEFGKHSRALRWSCNALFAGLFIAAPWVIHFVGLKRGWPGLVIGLFSLSIATAIVFRRAHLKLYPDADDERFTHFLTILLSPPTAIRALDALSRPLLENFHPLAVACVVCGQPEFRKLARLVFTEIRHPALPVCPGADPAAASTELQARETLRRTVEQFLRTNGIDPDELTRPPAPGDETCRAYCPRCGNQFTTVSGQCADCGGLPLVPFVSRN